MPYTNLITSGVGLPGERLAALADGGLDHVQISIQDSEAGSADHIAGYRGAFACKKALAAVVCRLGILLTVNIVVHRANIDRTPQTGEADPRSVVTSLPRAECEIKYFYEQLNCARGEMENRIEECQLDLYADRTSTATPRANQLRLWFASMAYVLLCRLRGIALHHTRFANATCGTIRLKLLKIGA